MVYYGVRLWGCTPLVAIRVVSKTQPSSCFSSAEEPLLVSYSLQNKRSWPPAPAFTILGPRPARWAWLTGHASSPWYIFSSGSWRAASPVCLMNFYSSVKVQLQHHSWDASVVLHNAFTHLYDPVWVCPGLGLCLLFWTMSSLKGLYFHLIHTWIHRH